MQIKVPLVDRRIKRNMSVLGCIVFAFALAYVYALPHLMYREAFALVGGKIEALLIRLATLYLYACGSRDIPWLILLILAVPELYQRPSIGGMMGVVSLILCLSPNSWWSRDFDIDLDDLEDDFSGIEGL
jgi:hypothetical protein